MSPEADEDTQSVPAEQDEAGEHAETEGADADPDRASGHDADSVFAELEAMGDDEDMREVRDILAGVETETEFARVDARLEELAGDVQRLTSEVERDMGARRGELEVMRARVEDALTHIGEATEEHRSTWRDLDRRLTELRSQFRDDLTEIEERLDDLLAAVVEPLRSEIEALELRTQADIEQSASALRDEVREEVEGTKREIEATAGELRAGQRLSTAELEERVGAVVARAVTGMRQAVSAHSERIERERSALADADRSVADRFSEMESRLERLENRAGTGQGRTEIELSRLDRQLGELTDRLAALERRRGADGDDREAEEVADLTARVERAEAIAREAGRVIVATLRQGRAGEAGRPSERVGQSEQSTAGD